MEFLDVLNNHANTLVLVWIAIELRLAQPHLRRVAKWLPKVGRTLGVTGADETARVQRAATEPGE